MKPAFLVVIAKKALDSAAGLVGCLFLALTYPIIAGIIRLESPGPVLYTQERVGINRRRRGRGNYSGPERRSEDVGGKIFLIYKYRTMRLDAEENGPVLCAQGHDPRITRSGRWLRALHIDELPQFINVFKGDMSLVGPRPERPHFTRQYSVSLPHYSDRTLHIKPGITGFAQIVLGYDDSFDSVVRKSHYDLSYRASFCSLTSWIKMEWWVIVNTFGYLLHRPSSNGEVRDLAGLRRAKLLPFRGKYRDVDDKELTKITVSCEKSVRPYVLVGESSSDLGEQLDRIPIKEKKGLEVWISPRNKLDLQDLAFLTEVAHTTKRHGGQVHIKSANPEMENILKEIRLDSVVQLQCGPREVRNFFTVDVECWFHAYNMQGKTPKSTWHLQPTNVEKNVRSILELLRVYDTTGTFFVLGWVADHFPDVVRMIADEGHEIGTHGYDHNLVTDMTPEGFEADLVKSLEALARLTSQPVIGHRASNFTIVKSTLWALEILARNGIQYDSSIFPIDRKRYGIPDYPNRLPHILQLENGHELKEFPMSTLQIGKGMIPMAGGGYLRLYPFAMTEKFIEGANAHGEPAMIYLHPWELDLDHQRHYLGLLKTFQHYVNTDSTEWKLNRLLQHFDFCSVRDSMELPRMRNFFRENKVEVRLLNQPSVSEGTPYPEPPGLHHFAEQA